MTINKRKESKMKQYNGEKVIVSLTSYCNRLKFVPKVIFSILTGTFKSIHIVLVVYKGDLKYISDDLHFLIDNDIIELIVSDEDIKPHKKYFYTMLKYKNTPIITIDDDQMYYPKTVEDYYNEYLKNPNIVLCRLCREMTFTDNKINKFENWIWHTKNPKPSRKTHAIGAAGILYPPDCLKITSDNLDEIKKCLLADDIYLNVLEIRNNVLVKWLNIKYGKVTNMFESKGDKTALSLRPDNMKITNEYIKLFEKEFNSCSR